MIMVTLIVIVHGDGDDNKETRISWSKSSHRFGSDVVDKAKKTTQKCVVLRSVS